MIRTLLWLLVLVAGSGEAYKHYQNNIPNGDKVPNPCSSGALWEGVGHKNVGGGGPRNLFGVDFAANGHKWDETICQKDSDGDGKTNGDELGDPGCVWSVGSAPPRTTGLSHPGVCEPLGSSTCKIKNDWSFCEQGIFNCDAVNGTDVTTLTFRFPKTKVPAQETTYWCMTFELPQDKDYHVIATKEIIDNKDVMHHIDLLGCADQLDDSWRKDSPDECRMVLDRCRNPISLWSLGQNGECLPDTYGIRIGATGFKAVLMQFHWNNPEKRADFTDMSGMTMYVTPNLRPNDAATLAVGADYLQIPPKKDLSPQYGYCHSNCTKWLPNTVYLADLGFHMHYLGVSARLEHTRAGQTINTITEATYAFDDPKGYRYDPPLEFRPGDELKITCNYNSKNRNGMTYYGEATSDEMCQVFITYYPARKDFSYCMSFRSLAICETEVGGEIVLSPTEGCDYDAFLEDQYLYPIFGDVDSKCNSSTKCPQGCKETVDKYRQREPCLRGDVGIYTEIEILAKFYGEYGRQWVRLLHACDADWDPTIVFRNNTGVIPGPTPPSGTASAEQCLSPIAVFLVVIPVLLSHQIS